jgi:NAD(P)-dependent dehydrogenase (short-subunit alcohol dehydrogenase family)
MEKVNEKLALIAGVNNPVSAAATKALRKAGWKVVGLDVHTALSAAEGLNENISIDMTNRSEFIVMVADIEEKHGKIDALLCATGFEPDRQCADFLKTPIDQWQKCLNGWLSSSINACYAVAPGMVTRQAGKIVILSPDYSKEEQDNVLNAVGAGTLHGFAKSFGVEMAADNVLVNCVWPNMPFDVDAIAAAVQFLFDGGDYVSAQVISIRGQEQGVQK